MPPRTANTIDGIPKTTYRLPPLASTLLKGGDGPSKGGKLQHSPVKQFRRASMPELSLDTYLDMPYDECMHRTVSLDDEADLDSIKEEDLVALLQDRSMADLMTQMTDTTSYPFTFHHPTDEEDSTRLVRMLQDMGHM
jgi:hypothetical protein